MAKELPNAFAMLTQTRRLLVEATTFVEFKEVRNRPQVAWIYAKSPQVGLQARIHAAELTLECERRAGREISSLVLANGGRQGKKKQGRLANMLKMLGINRANRPVGGLPGKAGGLNFDTLNPRTIKALLVPPTLVVSF